MFCTPGTHYSSTRQGPFRQLVLHVLASIQVITAVDTRGTREYSSHFSIGIQGTREYSVISAVVLNVLASTRPGQRVLSHISSRSQCTREDSAISAVKEFASTQLFQQLVLPVLASIQLF